MRATTDTQMEILRVLHALTERNGFAPTVREVAAERGSTVSPVQYSLDRLEEAGFIARQPGLSRTLRVTPAGLRALEVAS